MTARPRFVAVRPDGLDDRCRGRQGGHVTSNAASGQPWTPVDPVGGVLADLRIRGVFYCRAEATAPWGVAMPALDGCMSFHVVTEGSCVLEVDGVQSVLGPDGGGAPAGMVCGVVQPDRPGAAHLLDLLPPVLRVDGRDAARAGWLPVLLGVIADEVRHDRPGSEAVVTRLADVVVIQAVRAWLDTAATGPGWLRALRDPQVGRAVALLHREPGTAWTLTRLAREARMSRSSFAARFTELAGEPAMHYVARWRMHLATVALAEGARVGELARQLGYESEAAFSRAYKRVVGVPPVAATRRDPGRAEAPAALG